MMPLATIEVTPPIMGKGMATSRRKTPNGNPRYMATRTLLGMPTNTIEPLGL